ncbi:basic proline-rich protein-like [Perognathus longimembris pacificus]|uniref:basic proline-rich protein-like n=1 Tax=Perognathus longimembris pacificus TaxID=214514 RepID=UPI0020186447|nr:basic proline-rich protein-like [Perognathus longimembris pacificus]
MVKDEGDRPPAEVPGAPLPPGNGTHMPTEDRKRPLPRCYLSAATGCSAAIPTGCRTVRGASRNPPSGPPTGQRGPDEQPRRPGGSPPLHARPPARPGPAPRGPALPGTVRTRFPPAATPSLATASPEPPAAIPAVHGRCFSVPAMIRPFVRRNARAEEGNECRAGRGGATADVSPGAGRPVRLRPAERLPTPRRLPPTRSSLSHAEGGPGTSPSAASEGRGPRPAGLC